MSKKNLSSSLSQTASKQKGRAQINAGPDDKTINNLPAGLYLVPTPIGNLGDITIRAQEILRQVDLILCEDQRMTKKLLSHFLISNKTAPCHDYNEEKIIPKIIENLEKGQRIALVSDAGTPMISDPGYRLVRAVKAHGLYVTALPGANAILPAIQLSALPSQNFYFGGFLPAKKKARQTQLQQCKNIPSLLVFYESPHRLPEMLEDIKLIFGEAEISIAREISKKFEQAITAPIADVIQYVEAGDIPTKGEFVVLIDNHAATNAQIIQLDGAAFTQKISDGLKTYSAKDLAVKLAQETGLRKNEIYKRIQELKDDLS